MKQETKINKSTIDFRYDMTVSKRVVDRLTYIKTKHPVSLNTIHKDIDTAFDLCIIFLDNLKYTKFYFKKVLPERDRMINTGWWRLNTKILEKDYRGKHKAIIDYLIKYKIIIMDKSYQSGAYSRHYRYTDKYISCKIDNYKVITSYGKDIIDAIFKKEMDRVKDNPIVKVLLRTYPLLKLPTASNILKNGDKLISQGYKSKKGILLTKEKVKQHLEMYQVLIKKPIPTVGNVETCGGRVTDFITLMPSWIRTMIRIAGEPGVECDYSCLHPNLAMTIYGGQNTFIKHKDIADNLGVAVLEVKKEHLSFFNKRVSHMKSSPLWEYYTKTEPAMMKYLINDKEYNGYKVTCQRMFSLEVRLMSEAMSKLDRLNIPVVYIYDALMCRESDKGTVIRIMNDVASHNNAFTIAK